MLETSENHLHDTLKIRHDGYQNRDWMDHTIWKDAWTERQKQTAISLSSCEAEFDAAIGNRPLVGTLTTLRGTLYDKYHRHRAIKVDQSSRSEQDGLRQCRHQAVQSRRSQELQSEHPQLSELWSESRMEKMVRMVQMVRMERTRHLRMSTTESSRQRRQSSDRVSILSSTQTRFSRPRPRFQTRTRPPHYNTTPTNT